DDLTGIRLWLDWGLEFRGFGVVFQSSLFFDGVAFDPFRSRTMVWPLPKYRRRGPRADPQRPDSQPRVKRGMMAKQVLGATFALAMVGPMAIPANVAWGAATALYGARTLTCGEWQWHRSIGNKGATLQLQAWIDGFLSGSDEEIDFIAPKATEVAS